MSLLKLHVSETDKRKHRIIDNNRNDIFEYICSVSMLKIGPEYASLMFFIYLKENSRL